MTFQFKPTTIKGLRFKQVTSHRNGVIGNSFWCAVAQEHDRDMLITYFPHPEGCEGVGVSCAVYSIELLPDITFGINSWRGDDYVGAMIKAIEEWERQWDEYKVNA